jgi:hypothetical protein
MCAEIDQRCDADHDVTSVHLPAKQVHAVAPVGHVLSDQLPVEHIDQLCVVFPTVKRSDKMGCVASPNKLTSPVV